MAIVLADVGAAKVLTDYFITQGTVLTLKLFATNTTPADTDVAGTYTVAAGGGYSDKALLAANWTESNVGGIEQVAYADQVFTFTGALTTNGTIYGYYVVDAAGVLIYAEAGTPFTPANNGDTYTVKPKFQFSKGTPT
jgi:hypothetical protein